MSCNILIQFCNFKDSFIDIWHFKGLTRQMLALKFIQNVEIIFHKQTPKNCLKRTPE